MSRARTGLSNLATAYPRPVALGAPMVFLFVLGLTFPAQTQAVTPEKLAASPLDDNVQYLRFMVDPRLAEGKRAAFNAHFTDEKVSYAIALRNGVIAITDQPDRGPTIELSKDDWSQLIMGKKSFASLNASLEAFDGAIVH